MKLEGEGLFARTKLVGSCVVPEELRALLLSTHPDPSLGIISALDALGAGSFCGFLSLFNRGALGATELPGPLASAALYEDIFELACSDARMSIAVASKEGHSRMLLVDWGGWGITEHESLEEAISALFAKVRSTDYLTVPFHGSSLNKEHWFRVSGDFSKVCTAMSDSHDSFYPAHRGQAGKGSFEILIDRSLRFAASVTSFDDDDEQEIHVSFRPSEEPLMESFVTAYGQNLAAEGISAPRSF